MPHRLLKINEIIASITCHLFALSFVKKTLTRVLFLPRVCYVLGIFFLKLFFVEAYGNKVQQVCLVVVG